MANFLDSSAKTLFPPLKDNSMLSLIDFIHTGDSMSDQYGSPGKQGWDVNVSQMALDKYSNVSTTECSPFVVGGVGCNTAEGYKALLMLKAVHKAWVELAERKLTGSDFCKLASEVHDVVKGLTLPEKSAACTLQRAIPTLLEHAENAERVLSIKADTFCPEGLPGCLADNFLINGREMLAALIGSNIISAFEAVEQMDDSLPQIDLINDAYSWYIEAEKAKGDPIKCVFSASAENAIAGIKNLLEAAQRTNTGNIEPSTKAAVCIASWRNI